MAFSNYYHSNVVNKLLHLISYCLIFTCISRIIYSSLGIIFGIMFNLFLFRTYSKMSITATFGYIFTLFLGNTLFNKHLDFSRTDYIILIVICLLCQLAGHVIFQREFPAFRAFEALVSTPILCMMWFMNKFT